jgi:hypothetical protein
MPRLVTRSWNGQQHTAIEFGPGRPAHLDRPLGRVLATVAITEAEAKLGIAALAAAREQAEGYHGA